MTPQKYYLFKINDVEIPNPIGWDDLVVDAKRDPNTHGIFFDISGTTFKFWGKGNDILSSLFASDGIGAVAVLDIYQTCDYGQTFNLFFSGEIDFAKKEQVISMPCLFIAPVAQNSCMIQLQKRADEKVDVPTVEAINIPTKTILKYAKIQSLVTTDTDFGDFRGFIGDFQGTGDGGAASGRPYIYSKSAINIFAEDVVVMDDPLYLNSAGQCQNVGDINTLTGTSVTSFPEDPTPVDPPTFVAPVAGNYTFNWDFEMEIIVKAEILAGSGVRPFGACSAGDVFNYFKTDVAFEIDGYSTIFQGGSTIDTSCQTTGEKIQTINWASSAGSYFLNAGDKVRLIGKVVFGAQYRADNLSFADVRLSSKGRIIPGSFFEVILDDSINFPPTLTQVSFVDQAFYNIIQAITGGCMNFKSIYFGRTDGVNEEAADGCGGLNVITSGLKIRRLAGSLFLSLKKLFDSLSAIYNIGMGPEIIGGNLYLRVEKAKFFYDEQDIIYFDNNPDIKVKYDQSLSVNKLSIGYNKWESEGANGLDDIMTKREYAVPLRQIKGDLSKYSDVIASCYSIEKTRRESIQTRDFKYDNEAFILCTKRESGAILVEQGNVTNTAAIIDPANDYNFAITPARNALRWFKTAFIGVKNFTTELMLWKYGEGNYIAQSELTSGCTIEDGLVAENEAISYDDMTFAEGDLINHPGIPLYSGELIEFEAPFNDNLLAQIMNNPYQLIAVSPNTITYQVGWIKNMSYNKKKQRVKFTLLKKL